MKKYIHIVVIIILTIVIIIYLKINRTKIEDEITKNRYVTIGHVFKQKYGARDVSIVYKYRFKNDTLIASYPVEYPEKYMNKRYLVHCDSLKPENNVIFFESPR